MKTQIKKQTWKYLWKQKLEEILNFLGIIFIGYSLFGAIFFLVDFIFFCFGEEITPKFFFYNGIIIISIWIIVGLFYWIKSNWEEAKNRLMEDESIKEKKDKQRIPKR